MPTLVHLPVDAPRHLDDRGQYSASAEAHQSLRRLALGADPTPLRARAIAELACTDAPSRIRDLGAIVGDNTTPLRLRQLAAILLGRIDAASAREVLIDALGWPDQRLVGCVAQSLGRLGARAAFKAIEKAAAKFTGTPLAQARFALRLLAHRLNLTLPEWPDDAMKPAPRPGEAAATFRVTRAHPVDVEIASRSLALEPFGIELDESTARQIRCDGGSMMLFLNRGVDFDDPRALLSRKQFLGLAGRRSDDSGLYAPALLFLTTPVKGEGGEGVEVSAYHPNGSRLLAGRLVIRKDGLGFELRGVARRGALILDVEGTLAGREIAVSRALVGCRRTASGRPARRPR
jgi:hypothetical protein